MANTTLHPPGEVYASAARFAAELLAEQDAAAARMYAAWVQAYRHARIDYALLLAKMEAAQAAGVRLSPAWLYQEGRLSQALATTQAQMATYAVAASGETSAAQALAIQASAEHAALLGQAALTGTGLAAGFTQINEAHLRHAVGFLADGSPLHRLFATFADDATRQITDALTLGLIHGKGIAWMARQVDDALNMPRWRAETIMRTESQRVYRATARETYLANADTLTGWVWTAQLDSRTCPACVVMDGTFHPLADTLDGHPRCRCVMVPRTKTWAELGIGDVPDTRPPVRSGKAWLAQADPSVQLAILGRGKYKAWRGHRIGLDDVVGRTYDPRWGTMRRERSLREIERGLNANPATVTPRH